MTRANGSLRTPEAKQRRNGTAHPALRSEKGPSIERVVTTLRDARHLAAIADALGKQLTAEFTDQLGKGTRYVIESHEGTLEVPSPEAVLGLLAALAQIADAAHERVALLLKRPSGDMSAAPIQVVLDLLGECGEGVDQERDWSARAVPQRRTNAKEPRE